MNNDRSLGLVPNVYGGVQSTQEAKIELQAEEDQETHPVQHSPINQEEKVEGDGNDIAGGDDGGDDNDDDDDNEDDGATVRT